VSQADFCFELRVALRAVLPQSRQHPSGRPTKEIQILAVITERFEGGQ
jgi:hypothetical protein